MAEVTREKETTYNGTGWVAWAALLFSFLALILAWMAYNRTGQDLEDRVQQEVNRSIDTIQGQR